MAEYRKVIAALLLLWIPFSGISNGSFVPEDEVDAPEEMKMIEMEGTYQGENLLVSNPFFMATQTHCITKIFLNDKLIIEDPNHDKIGVSLTSFSKGEYVSVKIEHRAKCNPRVLNSKALLSATDYELVSVSVDNASIKWTTNDEKNQQPYILEQEQFSKWVPIQKIIANGTEGYNNYTASVTHFSGVNRYRIKRRHITRYFIYSKVLTFENDKEAATFYPTRVDKQIVLSESLAYNIKNERGKTVMTGQGAEIDASALASGVYYLQFDNKTEKFFKN